MALDTTFDTNTPLGSDAPAVIDDRIQEVKAAVQERMNDHNGSADEGDHYWPLTGTEVSDTDTGEHRKATLRNDWTHTGKERADTIILHAKDVSSVAELFALDENGNDIQLTSGGKTAIGHLLTAKTDGDSPVALAAADLTGNYTFTNYGATAAVEFQLPAGSSNYKVSFIVATAQALQIDPNGSEVIRDATQATSGDQYISSSTVGSMITLIWSGTSWQITEISGIWDITSN